MIFTIACLF